MSKFLDSLLFYVVGGVVVYSLFSSIGSKAVQLFKDAVKFAKDQFPETSKVITTFFNVPETILTQLELEKTSFIIKISDKLKLLVFDPKTGIEQLDSGFSNFKEVSSVSIEDLPTFQLLDSDEIKGDKYSYEGLYSSLLFPFSLAVLAVFDSYSRDLCALEKNQPKVGDCRLLISIECEKDFDIEYLFALMLAYDSAKKKFELDYPTLGYHLVLNTKCPIVISEINQDNMTFVSQKVKL